jgi:hypothetical protein
MANETRYNVALLEKVRDHIEDENKHDQGLWARISRAVLLAIPDRWIDEDGDKYITVSCPTAACVAGWAASLSGGMMLVDECAIGDGNYSRGSVESNDVLVKGQVRNISSYAREQLGLTLTEAEALFDGEWSNEETLDNLSDIIQAAKHGLEWEIRYHGGDDEDGGDY